MTIQPIFIFSAVRSGSTLVQRIVAAHEGVSTVSEPWLMLPLASTLRRSGVDAGYLHPLTVDAIEDFCAQLPSGSEDYLHELRELALRLYEKAAGANARYFLDKSPPYCFVAEEIMRIFPDGKFVFLWRNPLSIVSSIVDTWQPWRPSLFREDLFVGVPRLVDTYSANPARAHAVRFEDLLSDDNAHWSRLMDYLGIDFEPDALSRFSEVKLNGRMGDPTGVKRYSTLSPEPGQKWKATLANPLRKAWCRRYLSLLGGERLATMGYDLNCLIGELDALPASTDSLVGDLGRLIADASKEPIRVRARIRQTGAPNVIRDLLRVGIHRADRERTAPCQPREDFEAPRKNGIGLAVVGRTATLEKPTRT
jgi:Sulfotransferase family